MQGDLFASSQPGSSGQTGAPVRLPLADGCVDYFPGWLARAEADSFFRRLQTSLPWRQDSIKIYGKALKIPRLQSWHGDPHCDYAYSGLRLAPLGWTAELSDLRQRCRQTTGSEFNCVLANWYRDGQDSMSLHADDEPELGPRPVIASVTLGQPRPFVFKHRNTGARYTQVLEPGSLLVMAGDTQRHYLHGIAKTTKAIGARINLTFRCIQPAGFISNESESGYAKR